MRSANEVLALYQGTSEKEKEARATLLVAKTKQATGEAQEAKELAEKVVDMFDKANDPLLQGIALKQLANICFAGGDTIDGWSYAKEALMLFREVQHRHGEAAMLNQIANAHCETGVAEEAVHIAEESVTICRELNDRPQLGRALLAIADAHVAQIRFAKSDQQEQQLNWKSRLAGKEAMATFQMVGDRVGEAAALKTLATAFLNYGNAAEARARAKAAIEIAKDIGDKTMEGENLLLVAQSKLHENKDESARLARLAEKLLREAGASSAAKNAGDVFEFIYNYGKDEKTTQKKAAKAEPDVRTDVTVDVEEGKHRLAYFHGFTGRIIKPK